MIDATAPVRETKNPNRTAMDVLNKQLIIWYRQIEELGRSDFADRSGRVNALRRKCSAVTLSVKCLEQQGDAK